jgi:hypothetical protein
MTYALHKFHHLDKDCRTFLTVPATSAKFSLHAGNMKFNAQNEE